ncbi:unnamed protein product [Prunus armeniaca]
MGIGDRDTGHQPHTRAPKSRALQDMGIKTAWSKIAVSVSVADELDSSHLSHSQSPLGFSLCLVVGMSDMERHVSRCIS